MQETLPPALQQVQQALWPYIRQRQEVELARRVIAENLSKHVNEQASSTLLRPLPLVQSISSSEVSSSSIRGIRRDYVRTLRANGQAREEYQNVVLQHQALRVPDGRTTTSPEPFTNLYSFLDLVKLRRKQERLRIIQDYLDGLSHRPAAAIDYFHPDVVLKAQSSMPVVPPEVMNAPSVGQLPEKTDLRQLLGRLEQAVLRTKLLLKREQKLHAQVKAKMSSQQPISGAQRAKLQALGTTRNELINWMESELGKAGDNDQDCEHVSGVESHEHNGAHHIERQLNSIKRQYSRYIGSRKVLASTTSARVELSSSTLKQIQVEPPLISSGSIHTNVSDQMAYPFLDQLVSISNEQKAVVQQKSHLTTSLYKHHKENDRGLDRLADESHLLSAHSMPSVVLQRKATITFGDEISNHEKRNSTGRIKPWLFALNSATCATEDVVSKKLEDGRTAISHAQIVIGELERLLGVSVEHDHETDIWANLEGNLGVIKNVGGVVV